MEAAVTEGEQGIRNMRRERMTVSTAMDELDHKVSSIACSTELLYLVGADGRQISNNIFADSARAAEGRTARGRDWSQRGWFSAVRDSGKSHVTPLYRSSATNDFCFTVSVPVLDAQRRLVRVLGADVRLSSML